MTAENETKEQVTDSRNGWRIAAVALLISTVAQVGGWVYWFSGWKSVTDGALRQQADRISKLEESIDHLPRTLQRMDIQQRLLVQGLNTMLTKNGSAPVPILTAQPDEDVPNRRGH